MAASKNLPKQPDPDKIKRTKDWPGPGAYSPKNNMTEIAEKAKPTQGQIIKGENTFDVTKSSVMQEDSIRSFRRGGSAVELQVAKTIGKNPPPKLRVERPKV